MRDLIEDFAKMKRHIYSPVTLCNYKSDISQFMKYAEETMSYTTQVDIVKNVGYHACQEFVNSMIDNGLKEATINRKIESLRTFFKWCVLMKLTCENPINNIESLSVDHLDQKSQFITEQEMNRLLDTIETREKGARSFALTSSRDLLLYTIILTVGLRIKESLNLTFDDIDLEKKELKTIGKGNKMRHLPIDDNIIELYYNYMSEREKLNVKEGHENFIFLSPTGMQIDTSSSNKALKKYCARANITRISNHALRHTFATQSIEKGTDVNTISKMMGHTNVKTTSRYMHERMEVMREAIGINRTKTTT